MTVGRNNFTRTPVVARGFTLMELVLVMLIMAIVAAVAAPNLKNFISGRRAGDTAAQIVALAEYARSQAISEGRVYQLNIAQDGRVHLTYLDDANVSQDVVNDAGAAVSMPGTGGQITIDADLPRGDNGEQVAKFYPTGRVDPGTITVRDDRNQAITITSRSATENYHIPFNQGAR